MRESDRLKPAEVGKVPHALPCEVNRDAGYAALPAEYIGGDRMDKEYVKRKTILRLQSYIKDIEDGKIEVLDGVGLRPDTLEEKRVYEMYFRFLEIEDPYTHTPEWILVKNKDRCLKEEMYEPALERIKKVASAIEDNPDSLKYFTYGTSYGLGYLDISILDTEDGSDD